MAFQRAMWVVVAALVAATDGHGVGPAFDHDVTLPTSRPLNIAHRGSSGMIPEHTVRAYKLAIEQGADAIECDVCMTSDLQLVCRHEMWLNETTDVAKKFPDRSNTYFIPSQGKVITDYFTVDFTLAELKTLRVRQTHGYRDHSHDGMLPIATFDEYIQVAQNANRPVGLYPETKASEFVNSLEIVRSNSTTFERLVVDVLQSYGYSKKTDPCFLQSFSEDSIRALSRLTELPLVMLLYDDPDNVTDHDLYELAEFCYGIGPWKDMIVTVNPISSRISSQSDLLERAHRHGLRVHAYTYRNEDQYLAFNYGQDPYQEYDKFFNLKLDGYFTDFPATFNRYLESKYRDCESSGSVVQVHVVFMATVAIVMTVITE